MAGVADAPADQLQVFLVTYGPGTVYWERFGHDAIEIRDASTGQSFNFNYGVFDFSQAHFLLNFARGRPRYSMDAEPTRPEIDYYVDSGRAVHRQRLALSPAQAGALRDFLLWNLRPENRHYYYDYYVDNCATRVRDALNRALGGALKAAMDRPSAHHITYRSETDRLLGGKPWLMMVLDLGLSSYADQPLTEWQAAFIPMQLMRDIGHVRVSAAQGGSRPLVTRDQLVARSRLPAPPSTPPDLLPPLLAAGIVLGLVLLVSGRLRRRHRVARGVFTAVGTLWILFAGIAGIGMALLWGLTANHSAWGNENLLLFSPLALLLLPAVWKQSASRTSIWLVALLTAAALFALLAKALPGFDQHNLPWIAFALPPWIAMAWTLRRQQPPAT